MVKEGKKITEKKFLEMAIKVKPRQPPVFFFHVFFIKSILFNQFKFEICTTMSTLFYRGLNMGVFKNIWYLSHHILDNILFSETKVREFKTRL